MGFFKSHPLMSAITVFIFFTLPSAIEVYWSLYEKFKGISMPSLDLSFGIWLLPLIGLALAIFITLQATRTSKRVQNNTKGTQPIIIGAPLVGQRAKPEIQVGVGRTKLRERRGKILIDVSTDLYTSLPTKIGSLRLEVGGRYLDEYPEPRLGHNDLFSDIHGNAFFLKPNETGIQKGRLWLNANSQDWPSDEFTIDFDQKPELRK